jgi:diacylglycerol kinase family enzyme
MSRKIFVVANPNAGRGKIHHILRDLADYLSSKHIQHQIVETRWDCKGDDTVRNNLDQSFTDLAVVGGDGTINEASWEW